MRNLDRHINLDKYPKLFYPESYVLEGGFSQFYQKYANHCDGYYMRMDDNKENCEEMFHTSKKLHQNYDCR
jgi:M-phase inducer tyrosine phosphatase